MLGFRTCRDSVCRDSVGKPQKGAAGSHHFFVKTVAFFMVPFASST